MPPLAVSRLDGGDLVLQSRLWATNSAIVRGGGACLVCDPSLFPDEIAQIRAATRGPEPVYVFVTHSDFDHVCGLPAFADATVVAGTSTAAAVADGTARRKLDEGGRECGTAWEGELRVDIGVSGGYVGCGELEVEVVECVGHSDDGSAFVIADRGLLLAGDYLSPVCPPIVLGSFDGAVAAIKRLMRAIDRHGVSTVVPGHGPVLDGDRARQVAREDIGYLQALQAAGEEAVRRGLSPDAALSMVTAVAPPRRARPDFARFDWPLANARRALVEAET